MSEPYPVLTKVLMVLLLIFTVILNEVNCVSPLDNICDELVYCENDPCDCAVSSLDLDPNCQNCNQGSGCTQCSTGYFRPAGDTKCVECLSIPNCDHCTNNLGCQQCNDVNNCQLVSNDCGLTVCNCGDVITPNPTGMLINDNVVFMFYLFF